MSTMQETFAADEQLIGSDGNPVRAVVEYFGVFLEEFRGEDGEVDKSKTCGAERPYYACSTRMRQSGVSDIKGVSGQFHLHDLRTLEQIDAGLRVFGCSDEICAEVRSIVLCEDCKLKTDATRDGIIVKVRQLHF
ncbi:hypothetical protein HOF56_03460 [Candidatus Peribacteria bacterium]|jgi:hypothetical protein|nr:hypothetical protein [Candidatus Peribacteria bacterium]MBT4021073.1 hypothetical protein [Candidatus Peribacteria bacterium]MBT4240794.1 hypothetical protein [Candidatus Peribacteria bacterium]MBT4474177.1 hypothetical protein [Candidatus Peribacteria bacterium]